MSDAYSGQSSFGGSLVDLVSTQKGGAQTLGRLAQGLTNAYPIATSAASPAAFGFSLGSTATTVIAANPNRHGILFHVPSTGSIGIYVFPSNATPAPSFASPAGTILISAGSTVMFPSTQFPNVNCQFNAFAGSTGGGNPFTVWEFY